jgi:hypothetical protein
MRCACACGIENKEQAEEIHNVYSVRYIEQSILRVYSETRYEKESRHIITIKLKQLTQTTVALYRVLVSFIVNTTTYRYNFSHRYHLLPVAHR